MGKAIELSKFCNAAIPHPVFCLLLFVSAASVNAGGGVALKDDQCIIKIDFYSAHFTAYQPESSGDKQYCENLPETGATIFVLDYLHRSLKEVPVDFRIIRNVTELGAYARLADVQALGNLDVHTVYYRPPIVERTGSYKAEVQFSEPGEYIGVVSAGHPSNDKIYFAVFPFSVGASSVPLWLFYIAAGLIAAGVISFSFRKRGARARRVVNEPG
jgi:hypothetical protein